MGARLVNDEVWRTLRHSTTPPRLLTPYDLFSPNLAWKRKKILVFSEAASVYPQRLLSRLFFFFFNLSSSAFRRFNLEVTLFQLPQNSSGRENNTASTRPSTSLFSPDCNFHLHVTEVINLPHYDPCSLHLSGCLIVRLKKSTLVLTLFISS